MTASIHFLLDALPPIHGPCPVSLTAFCSPKTYQRAMLGLQWLLFLLLDGLLAQQGTAATAATESAHPSAFGSRFHTSGWDHPATDVAIVQEELAYDPGARLTAGGDPSLPVTAGLVMGSSCNLATADTRHAVTRRYALPNTVTGIACSYA